MDTIYIIIVSFFILGAVGFYFVNRNKDKTESKKNWLKYVVYFFLINLVFFSIVIKPIVFRFLTVGITLIGLYEIYRLFRKANYNNLDVFVIGIVLMLLFGTGFVAFGTLSSNIILYTFLTASIFDSFSQISGQLFGRKKLFPAISPNKTLGGFIGGAIVAFGGAFLLRDLYPYSQIKFVTNTLGIILFALLGDLLTSLYKRKFKVKDYSNLIPGHGGILDRFDSLIATGAWVAFYNYLI